MHTWGSSDEPDRRPAVIGEPIELSTSSEEEVDESSSEEALPEKIEINLHTMDASQRPRVELSN